MSFKNQVLFLLLVFEVGCTHPKEVITMKNAHGMEVLVIPYGGIVTSIRTRDRNGHFDDVVLGYDHADDYMKNNGPYMGAIIGRYANRIAKGMFAIDGEAYKLAT